MKGLSIGLVVIMTFLQATRLQSQVKGIGLPKIVNFTKSDYGAGTQNWQIDQDTIGNMYFANNNGLLQFDGNTWQLYKIPNSTNVRSLKYDAENGRIYVGGYNQFGYFGSDSKGKLKYTSLIPLIENEDYKATDFIWRIHKFKEEIIFQTFHRAYILKDNKIDILEAPRQFQFSFSVNDEIYFQDFFTGVYHYNEGALEFLKGTEQLANSEIWGMFSPAENIILLATLEKGLFVYENGKILPWKTDANEFVKVNSSLGGSVINDRYLALNTVLDGVIISDFEGKTIQHIDLGKGLQNNTVLSTFVDRSKNLWLGLDNGISLLNISSPFTYFSSDLNKSSVYATVLHNGVLYVATNQGVFYNSLYGYNTADKFTLVEGTNAQNWNIQVIDDNLICSNNRGALIIKDNKVVKNLDKRGYYGFKEIPNNPDHVIGVNYSGVAIFKKTKGDLQFMHQLEGFDIASNFFEIDQNFLWLKRDRFLYQLALSNDLRSLNVIAVHTQINDEAIDNLQFVNDRIYFQSANRFYIYNNLNGQFVEDIKLSDLFENIPMVNTVTMDKVGNLWYNYKESLGVFLKDANNGYTNLEKPFSGLTGSFVPNYLSVNTIDNRNIFIGLIDGLAHFDATLIRTREKPKAIIRSFTYKNDTIVQGNPQQKSFDIKIPFKYNNVQFTFSSPEFDNNGPILYAYKLEPFDTDWSSWSPISIKEYTNLREKRYQMKVKVKNGNGNESETAIVEFAILPPWYRHTLAYIAYFLLFLSSIYGIRLWMKFKIRKNRYYQTLEQRKRYLEKEAKIKSEQYKLEKQIEKLNRNKLQTKILSKDKELVSHSLQVVKKNKILNGIIDKLKKLETEAMSGETKSRLKTLKRSILKEVNADKSWKHLEKHIKNVHFDFLKRLKEQYPNISPRELDLATYLLLNMSSKEIAEVMNISIGGVELARYRLRKKLGLKRKQNLTGFLMEI